MPTRSLELKVPPMAVWVLAMAAVWVTDRIFPAVRIEFPGQGPIALALGIVGFVVAVSGVVSFRRARTTVNPLDPSAASSLVTSGIYRLTRNPMYLGVLVCLLGWVVHLGNPAGLVFASAFVWFLNRFQILPEERILAARFGAEFERYRAAVRRWI